MSPYQGKAVEEWAAITRDLIAIHPLHEEELVEVVLSSWEDILRTRIAGRLQIGVDSKLSPQMMGNFLHALIPVELGERYPGVWRKDAVKTEKDIVYIPDNALSIEVKTSSHASTIFANRSYAQPSLPGVKVKDGYYLAVNFEKFDVGPRPRISKIAFGWLDHTDWVPQASPTGQQAYLTPAAKASKLVPLYRK
jgi:hypothetical protein